MRGGAAASSRSPTFNASSDLVEPSQDWIWYAVTLGSGLMVLLAPGLRRSHAGTEVLR
jgi:hypothetical protein